MNERKADGGKWKIEQYSGRPETAIMCFVVLLCLLPFTLLLDAINGVTVMLQYALSMPLCGPSMLLCIFSILLCGVQDALDLLNAVLPSAGLDDSWVPASCSFE